MKSVVFKSYLNKIKTLPNMNFEVPLLSVRDLLTFYKVFSEPYFFQKLQLNFDTLMMGVDWKVA